MTCVVVSLLCAFSVVGQENTGTTIKTTTRLVDVEVVAVDNKDGHPISGLGAKDFVLLDNGKPQRIARFSVETVGSTPAETVAAQQGLLKAFASGTIYSNVGQQTVSPVIILYDLLNTPVTAQTFTRGQLLKALDSLDGKTPVALLQLTSFVQVLSDFTLDGNQLLASLDKAQVGRQEGLEPELTPADTPNAKANLEIRKINGRLFPGIVRRRAEVTLNALDSVRRQLSNLPGRKKLIWISGGTEIPLVEMSTLRKVVDAFNDANISVYGIDARGVFGDSSDASERFLNPEFYVPRMDENGRGLVLDTVAIDTGGISFRNTNGLKRAIARSVNDGQVVYSLAYYPTHGSWDGSFHKLTVKTERMDVRLRYRSGYLATVTPDEVPADSEARLREVVDGRANFPGIRFSVEVAPNAPAGSAKLLLHILGDDLSLKLAQGREVGLLQVWMIQRKADGTNLDSPLTNFNLHFAPSEYEQVLHRGLVLPRTLSLKPEAAFARVVVRDDGSGKIGSVDVPLAGNPK